MFSLGLIKYIVIQLHDAHSKLLYVSAVTCPELITFVLVLQKGAVKTRYLRHTLYVLEWNPWPSRTSFHTGNLTPPSTVWHYRLV